MHKSFLMFCEKSDVFIIHKNELFYPFKVKAEFSDATAQKMHFMKRKIIPIHFVVYKGKINAFKQFRLLFQTFKTRNL